MNSQTPMHVYKCLEWNLRYIDIFLEIYTRNKTKFKLYRGQ